MRARTLTLAIAAIATAAGLGTAVATTRPAAKIDHASVLMGVGNPHGPTIAAANSAVDPEELKRWETMYSRDVWPGMGVANVHTR